MATCARCGAATSPEASACPACGAGRATAPLGSGGEPPVRSGTLVLGSGVPIAGPAVVPRAPPEPERRRRPAPPPARDRRAERQRVPRLAPAPVAPGPAAAAPRPARRWWLVPLGAVLLAALLSALVATRRTRSLRGDVRFDAAGGAELEVSCPSCPVGTTLALGGQTARLEAGRASFRLEPPLALGPRRATLEIRAPGKAPRTEELDYRVEFVISPDLRGLTQPDPRLAVAFDAARDVSFIVDGRVVEPGASGMRRYEVPIRADLTGPAREAAALSKRVPYLVKLASGETVRGEVELASNIVPLVVDAPGESIVIEGTSFMLAGRTERDGMVTVEGRAITVDPSGRFAQLMSVSSVGDTTITVRAAAPGRAPRLVPIRVKRVASLTAEAALFEQRAQVSFSAIADDLDAKLGWAVVIEGKVEKIESDGYVTSVLVDVTRGCAKPPCRAALRLGDKSGLSPGMVVRAYGFLAGKYPDPAGGRDLPEVRVEFVRGQK